MLTRAEVIQSYLDLFPNPRYLEIGVSQGVTFHGVRASQKIAVDPKFTIKPGEREPSSIYLEITSDAFFFTTTVERRYFDVIYLDGLHTFEQTLRDLLNAIDYITDEGVIVIDDIYPNSYHASLPDFTQAMAARKASGSENMSWMGDTYRLVYFIQAFLPQFWYATVGENHGQLVMWRAKRDARLVPQTTLEAVSRLQFCDIVTRRADYNFMPNGQIVQALRQSLTLRRG